MCSVRPGSVIAASSCWGMDVRLTWDRLVRRKLMVVAVCRSSRLALLLLRLLQPFL